MAWDDENRAEHQRDLTTLTKVVYPVQGNDPIARVSPARRLANEIQFVAPALGQLRPLASSTTASGAAGVTTVNLPAVPDSVSRVIAGIDASHNDPAARLVEIYLLRGPILTALQAQAAVATSQRVALGRSLTLVPGDIVRIIVTGLAAGQVATVNAAWIDYPEGALFQTTT